MDPLHSPRIRNAMADEPYTTLRPFDALSPRGLAGKREYVLDLEQKGDPGSIKLLVECLADESGYLRDLAAAALVRLNSPAAPILPLLSSGLWYTRVSAVRTLGRLAAREAAHPLGALLSDTNESVQGETVSALAAIARGGSDVHVARSLFARGDVERTRALRDLRARDPELARRLEGLFLDRDLMSAEEHELLTPERSRAGDDGVAWDLLTGATAEGPHRP
jgi:HEAT repeat protein